MGLDMYLIAEKYHYARGNNKLKVIEVDEDGHETELLETTELTTKHEVAYWRKFYALDDYIHERYAEKFESGLSGDRAYLEPDDVRELERELSSLDAQGIKEFLGRYQDEYDYEAFQHTLEQLGALVERPDFEDYDYWYEISY